MAEYFINYHPNYDYSTIIVGKGGFISKEYTSENKWISIVQGREFSFRKGHLYRLLEHLRKEKPDCVIKIRNERDEDWQILEEGDRIHQRLEIIKAKDVRHEKGEL